MSNDIPFQFRLPRKQILNLRVPKKKVNIFLSILWDNLTEKIGRMGCLHNYLPTDNPELYIYRVDWSDISLSFDAQLEFINHTFKGITEARLAVVDRETGQENNEVTETILTLIRQAQEESLREQEKNPSSIACVPIITLTPLNGIYALVESTITPLKKNPEALGKDQQFVSILQFFVFSKSYQEKLAEAIDKARITAAGLSLLTQNLFMSDFNNITFLDVPTEQDVSNTTKQVAYGVFVPDDGLIVDQLRPDENGILYFVDDQSVTKDIIEPGDVIVDNTIALPARASQALEYIINNKDASQAAFRFQEGLIFQHEMIYYPGKSSLGDMLTPYQLVAFVAAIEALLDTSPIDIELACPSCGQVITVKERQINKTFQAFVRNQSENNPVFEKVFKEIYNDRSKFVHTGKDLYNRTAMRPNRPLILDGKNILAYKPQYHFNMPDYVGWLIRRYIYRSVFS